MGNEVYIESILDNEMGMLRSVLHGRGQQFFALFNNTIEYYWEQDAEQRFTQVVVAPRAGGAEGGNMFIGRRFWDLESAIDLNFSMWTEYKRRFQHRQEMQGLVFCKKPLGKPQRYFAINAKPYFDVDGEFLGYCGIVVDISSQRYRDDYFTTIEHAAIGIAQVSADGKFLFVNKKMCEILGYARDELVGMAADTLSVSADKGLVQRMRATQLAEGKNESLQVEKRYTRKDGKVIWVRLTVTNITADIGGEDFDISVVEDITERVIAEESFKYLATHDELTALPNRMMFTNLLRLSLDLAKRNKRQIAVMLIDLDRFKYIIDSLGHAAGDYVLQEMGQRYKSCVRASDVVARLGGDEFAILLQEISGVESVTMVAKKILEITRAPIQLLQHECCITASIGVSVYPLDGEDDISLLRKADKALYEVKGDGKNNFQFCAKEIEGSSTHQIQMETLLNRAIENNEFELYYQPKVHVASGTILSAEALLRWNSPILGQVPPGRFIPLVEELELIIPIGRWVIEQACGQLHSWREKGLSVKSVAVNLSPRQFTDPALIGFIQSTLRSFELPGAALELEITEGVVMQKPEKALEILHAIKALGVKVAIDDFGTGYSSLGQLKRLPVDTLKIDRSFIQDIETVTQDQAITRAIITMGKSLGLTIVAEGVETAGQAAFLSAHGCDEIQGYFYARPAPVKDFELVISRFGR
jgi:diguanylate cyclase (GGDEF)-like protein/PAS domain S-box-containing protein